MQDVQKLRNETKYPPKSQMHKAANYFLNEWDGIEAISHYGDVDWDNNRLERPPLRQFAQQIMASGVLDDRRCPFTFHNPQI
ncbi:MAG: IS66 family transposase [Bacteroidales bacterium]|nr:IS66 family transposase [Bacteroidales bacterium]